MKQMIYNITDTFKTLVSDSSVNKLSISQPYISIEAQLCYKQSEDILQNLNKITIIQNTTKQNYFSNAAYSYNAFSDHQRNQFDKEMRDMIKSANIKINEMSQVVKGVRFYNTTEKEHLGSVVMCLYQKYRIVCDVFKTFLEFNQNRKKKLQTMLGNQMKQTYKTRKPVSSQPLPEQRVSMVPRNEQIDPQIRKESQQIYEQRMTEQLKIQDTRKTLEQINNMLQVMENKVLQQQMLTSSFRQIGQIGLFYIQKGNKNLVDANILSKDSGKMWTLFFLTLAITLLVLDYLKS